MNIMKKQYVFLIILLVLIILIPQYYKKKQYEKNKLDSEVRMENFSTGLDYYSLAIDKYYFEEKPEEALILVNKAFETYPKNVSSDGILKGNIYGLSNIYQLRGQIYQDLGYIEEAIDNYTRDIDLNANISRVTSAYVNRASAKILVGDYEGAINDLDKSLELSPEYLVAYYERGIAKIKYGKKKSGCLDLSTAIELNYDLAQNDFKKYCVQ